MSAQSERDQTDREVCANCGERVYWGHMMWSGGGNLPAGGRTSHGYGENRCQEAHDFRHGDGMLDHYEQAIQALVQITEKCGRAMSEMDDDEWGNAELLQKIITDTYALASDGYSKKEVAA